ncbi:hypothetical protein ABIE85_008362 [Bradyrhizobium diazoefficiens]|jgi:hypothetical protein|uniref:hypothetical protein n=1 Tax=Bradyrhizobium diazoefficiens TaxID=1355477 RepID=UPI00272C7025|nr:hypothetical protein [Bradyrhizobium diazoefficiens]WLA58531.1 hypothetical protein QIH81_07680 [Bradyrhizobium diazoefficiens]
MSRPTEDEVSASFARTQGLAPQHRIQRLRRDLPNIEDDQIKWIFERERYGRLFESAWGRPPSTDKELEAYVAHPTHAVYCGDFLPATKLPADHYLVHNHVRPVNPLGLNGFRAWVTDDHDRLVECHCDFGGCRNADINPHYRLQR